MNLKSFNKVRDFQNNDSGDSLITEELSQATTIWKSLSDRFDCWIIQNNLDLAPDSPLGNREGTESNGHNSVAREINRLLVIKSKNFSQVLIHDINALSASIGLDDWWSSRDLIETVIKSQKIGLTD